MISHTPRAIWLAGLIIFAAAGWPPIAPPPQVEDDPDKPVIEKVEIAGETFHLELAADNLSRAKGLSGREDLENDRGMLFAYPRAGLRSFWMKGCLIEIDLIFLNSSGRIVAMHEMPKPPPRKPRESLIQYESRLERYPSRRLAQFAIELKSGSIERLELELGDRIDLDVKRLRALASE